MKAKEMFPSPFGVLFLLTVDEVFVVPYGTVSVPFRGSIPSNGISYNILIYTANAFPSPFGVLFLLTLSPAARHPSHP